jgi:cysteine synthase
MPKQMVYNQEENSEGTSGNTGMGLALVAIIKGIN